MGKPIFIKEQTMDRQSNQNSANSIKYQNNFNERDKNSEEEARQINSPTQNYCDLTLQEIKDFLQLIKNNFPKRSPESMVAAAYDYLGLDRNNRINQMMPPIQRMDYRYQNSNWGPPQQMNYDSYPAPPSRPIRQPPPMYNGGYQDAPMKRRGRGRPAKLGNQQMPQQAPVYMNMNGRENFMNLQKKDRDKKLAQIFLQRGYSISFARQALNFDLQANIYYLSMRQIMSQAFKKLQGIVLNNCKDVTPIDAEQMRTMKFTTELCNCAKWMTDQQNATFREYIKCISELSPQVVTKTQTFKLYQSIIRNWDIAKNTDGRSRVRQNGEVNQDNSAIRMGVGNGKNQVDGQKKINGS